VACLTSTIQRGNLLISYIPQFSDVPAHWSRGNDAWLSPHRVDWQQLALRFYGEEILILRGRKIRRIEREDGSPLRTRLADRVDKDFSYPPGGFNVT